MSDLVDEARNMEDNHLRTGDSYQATLYGKLATEIEAYKKDVFIDLGRDEETGLILFRTWKDQAHIYKEQRDDLAAALRKIRDDHIEGPPFWEDIDAALANLDGETSDNRALGDSE